jgi:hypothetical protein
MSLRKSSLGRPGQGFFRIFIEHLFLELFKPVVRAVLGPMSFANSDALFP